MTHRPRPRPQIAPSAAAERVARLPKRGAWYPSRRCGRPHNASMGDRRQDSPPFPSPPSLPLSCSGTEEFNAADPSTGVMAVDSHIFPPSTYRPPPPPQYRTLMTRLPCHPRWL